MNKLNEFLDKLFTMNATMALSLWCGIGGLLMTISEPDQTSSLTGPILIGGGIVGFGFGLAKLKEDGKSKNLRNMIP